VKADATLLAEVLDVLSPGAGRPEPPRDDRRLRRASRRRGARDARGQRLRRHRGGKRRSVARTAAARRGTGLSFLRSLVEQIGGRSSDGVGRGGTRYQVLAPRRGRRSVMIGRKRLPRGRGQREDEPAPRPRRRSRPGSLRRAARRSAARGQPEPRSGHLLAPGPLDLVEAFEDPLALARGMPMPVSVTVASAMAPARHTDTSTDPLPG